MARPRFWQLTSRSVLLGLVAGLTILNIATLFLLATLNASLSRTHLFHSLWLACVWGHSVLMFLFARRYERLAIHEASTTPSPGPNRTMLALLGGTGLLSLAVPIWLSNTLGFILEVRSSPQEIFYGWNCQWYFALLILDGLQGAYHAESLYRTGHRRFLMRATLFALIGTLAFWMLLASLALMYHYLRVTALMVGGIPALLTDALFFVSLFQPADGREFQVSRQMVYRSYTLLISGIFLLLLGFMGEIVRIIGTHLNFFLAFVTAFLLLLLSLMGLLFGSIKERVRGFIARNFYKSYYDYRVEWERANRRILSAQDMKTLQTEALIAVMEPTGIEGGHLLWRRPEGTWFVAASYGHVQTLDIQKLSASLFDWIWRYGKPVRREDIPPSQEENALLREWGIEVLMPLIFDKELVALLLLGSAPRRLMEEDLEFLETLGAQISLALMNQQYRESLMEAQELEHFHRIAAFLLHDLKNAASMLSMILENAPANLDNVEFRNDMLRTMHGIAGRIQRLISRLSTPAPEKLELRPTDLRSLIEETVQQTGVENLPHIHFQAVYGSVPPVSVAPAEIQRVIHNLLLNAIEATETGGDITLTLDMRGACAVIEVRDTGCGMSEEFIVQHLFKPFRTSKPKGLGIGLYHCKTIVEAHGGTIEVESEEGKGSLFRVSLPLA